MCVEGGKGGWRLVDVVRECLELAGGKVQCTASAKPTSEALALKLPHLRAQSGVSISISLIMRGRYPHGKLAEDVVHERALLLPALERVPHQVPLCQTWVDVLDDLVTV